MRLFTLGRGGLVLALLIASCGSSPPPCDGTTPPLGSPADLHPLASDAGFTLTGPFDAGEPRLRVTAQGPALRPACGRPDAGGYVFGYPDGGHDFYFDDGGLVDADGGCRRIEALMRALVPALATQDVLEGGEMSLSDGGVIEVFTFHDWKNADAAVQIVGNTLVDAGVAGPIDLVAHTERLFCL